MSEPATVVELQSAGINAAAHREAVIVAPAQEAAGVRVPVGADAVVAAPTELRAGRKPQRLERDTEVLRSRNDDRLVAGMLHQLPPRNTRDPDSLGGLTGSSLGDLPCHPSKLSLHHSHTFPCMS